MRVRPLCAVVLAAGHGTRMRSALPKPLHPLCGRPMVLHVLDALSELYVERAVVVVGHGAEPITKTLQEHGPPDLLIDFVEQRVTRGTADALAVALTALPDDPDLDDADIVVLPCDTPLVRPATLGDLVSEHRESDAAAAILTAKPDDAGGLGRVLRAKDGRIARVVEDSDATEAERDIEEAATSIYCFRRGLLAPALRRVSPENTKGEYYLSDVVAVLHGTGHKVVGLIADDPSEAVGVNDRAQLAEAEAVLRRRINERWMRAGVTMVDPANTYVDAAVHLAPDVTLLPGTVLQGRTVIARGARVGPNTRLVDCLVGEGATVEQTTAHDAEIGASSTVGPFASIAAGAHIAPGATTGAFYTARGGDDDGV